MLRKYHFKRKGKTARNRRHKVQHSAISEEEQEELLQYLKGILQFLLESKYGFVDEIRFFVREYKENGKGIKGKVGRKRGEKVL